MIGQGYPGKNYKLRFKMIIQYDEYNHEVLFDDLNDLFKNIIADKEVDGNNKNELFDEYSVLTDKTNYSKSLKERILLKIKSV